MKCDICGAEDPSVHTIDVHIDGSRAEESSLQRCVCEACARKAGMEFPSAEQQALAIVPKFRRLAAFIRSNNRMPNPQELRNLGAAGDLSDTLPGTPEFDRQLRFLEECADFIEENRRLPTEQEMPDPF